MSKAYNQRSLYQQAKWIQVGIYLQFVYLTEADNRFYFNLSFFFFSETSPSFYFFLSFHLLFSFTSSAKEYFCVDLIFSLKIQICPRRLQWSLGSNPQLIHNGHHLGEWQLQCGNIRKEDPCWVLCFQEVCQPCRCPHLYDPGWISSMASYRLRYVDLHPLFPVALSRSTHTGYHDS